ncbi:MAG TPA: hypothetical protein VGR00_01520, partial [Thermoanaerobaculia bacterium]|nr:hypothetical protein [Thermoanaerobaculia bacterium]
RSAARRLVTTYPPEKDGFPEAPRLRTLATLEARSGEFDAAARHARRLREIGVLDVAAIRLEYQALVAARRGDEADEVRELLLSLSPAALRGSVPSPFGTHEEKR